jgi:hypothetical protein
MKHTHMLLLLLLLAGITATTPAAAQTDERCFAETGYCISGPIRAYWEHNGGLPVFGYPISEQQVETVEDRTIPVQWFERDRLEIQDDGTITAGRLGARVLELQWRPWQPGNEAPIASPECRFFPQTGYNVCGWILGYWERNGGLERFGYPITAGMEETIEGQTYAVQYFERRRMELHPNPERGVLTGVCMSGLWRIAKHQKTLRFCLRSEGPLVQKRSSIMMSRGSLRPKIYACAPV